MRKAFLKLITGGARSGKTAFAQREALSLSDHPIYLATAKRYEDAEFQNRIERHIEDRDTRWTTIEEQTKISSYEFTNQVVVIDCVTLWLTNFFTAYQYETERCLEAVKMEMETLLTVDATIFMITNELGMGVHAQTEIGRKFTDLQGWTNQFIAGKANSVVLMVSGIPLTIK